MPVRSVMEPYDTERTYKLLRRAQTGDSAAKEQLILENMKLVYKISARFYGRGTDKEDIHQIGVLGLLSAIERFDIRQGTRFSTYAVPVIMGEIKRFFRDDGMIKVSRNLKSLAGQAAKLSEQIRIRENRTPTVRELAETLHVSPAELAQAEKAHLPIRSFSAPIDDSGKPLADLLPAPDKSAHLLERLDIENAVSTLSPRDRSILYMRYVQDKTQTAISKRLGISQVQVSRLEKKILSTLKNQLNFAENSGISGEKY